MGSPQVIADSAGHPKSALGRLRPMCLTITLAAGPTLSDKIVITALMPTKPIPTVNAERKAFVHFTLKQRASMKRKSGNMTVAPIPNIY